MSVGLGIPYADGEWTPEGIVRTCPVCGERVLEPTEWYDEVGEHHGKDTGMPEGYALHWMVYHAELMT